ncbi:MAG: sigma-54-dependent Fis family transcriptional regulator [Polyangiaceae bacterium]|nr:sigma-54-dependent Fis family transcriptional regulator [Polyangiaceae bacterium]
MVPRGRIGQNGAVAEPPLILVVDDDPSVGTVLQALVRQAGMRAVHVPSGEVALSAIEEQPFDLVVTDLRMPGMDGMTLLGRLARTTPDLPVVVLTAHGTVPLAVAAMRAGAADFLLKPFDRDELLFVLRKVLAATKHLSEEALLSPSLAPNAQGHVVASDAMRGVWDLARRAASTIASVLLRGETGVGKEGIARAIHELGPRREQPFVKLHCAAFPEALLESELFGYEKGAFTGAAHRKPGRVELAQGGTLFLDEIGEVTPAVQVKLLRLLQDREIERLGSIHSIRVDVRVVTATHRPLERMIREGTFREDLFYRIAVVPIFVPPLRERPEDIPPLVHHFLRRFAVEHQRPKLDLDVAARQALAREPWLGNVRELMNFVERLVVLSPSDWVTHADVLRELDRGRVAALPEAATMLGEGHGPATSRQISRDDLVDTLARAGNNRALAARLLGVSRRTLYNKLVEHGLPRAKG